MRPAGIELVSATFVFILLGVAANAAFQPTGAEMVLGTSTVVTDGSVLPGWVYISLGGLLVMAVVVLITVILSEATVRKLKRG